MDPNIWSTLPTDILLLIIEACNDTATSRAFAAATCYSPALYRFASKVAYGNTTVTAGDLIAYPDAYPGLTAESASDGKWSRADWWTPDENEISSRALTAKHMKYNAQNADGLINRLLASKPAGVPPAHYIKKLTLDLRPQTIPSEVPAAPSIEVLQHTLSKLCPALSSLQSLRVDNPVHFQVLGTFAKRLPAGQKVSKLVLRRGYASSGYYLDVDDIGNAFKPADGRPANDENSSTPLEADEPLAFPKYFSPVLTDALKTLELNDLTCCEEDRLAKFVLRLKVLEDLKIRTGQSSLKLARHAGIPMTLLIGPSIHLIGNLPSTLKKLELEDCYFLEDDCPALAIPPAPPKGDDIRQGGPSLTTLTLYLDSPTASTAVLSHLPTSKLEHLTIQAGSKSSSFSKPFLTYISMSSYFYYRLITPHLSTLKTITLANLWHVGQPSLITLLNLFLEDNGFAFTDLILGTNSPEAILDLRMLSLDYEGPINIKTLSLWGQKIERARFEYPNGFNNLDLVKDVDIAFLSSMKNLRVLILVSSRFSLGHILPDEPETFTGGKLATHILKYATSRLRYIAVGCDRFWVDHVPSDSPSNPSAKPTKKLIYFRRAISAEGPEQEEIRQRRKREVKDWMNKDDEVFIDPKSKMNKERYKTANDSSDYRTIVRSNFVVARRVSKA